MKGVVLAGGSFLRTKMDTLALGNLLVHKPAAFELPDGGPGPRRRTSFFRALGWPRRGEAWFFRPILPGFLRAHSSTKPVFSPGHLRHRENRGHDGRSAGRAPPGHRVGRPAFLRSF